MLCYAMLCPVLTWEFESVSESVTIQMKATTTTEQ